MESSFNCLMNRYFFDLTNQISGVQTNSKTICEVEAYFCEVGELLLSIIGLTGHFLSLFCALRIEESRDLALK